MTSTMRRWLRADPWIDLVLAAGAAVAAFALSFSDETWRHALTDPVLADQTWPGYMQTLSGVSATLLGFGTTAIAISIAMSPGRRGQRVLAQAGEDLTRILAHCLGSLLFASLALALAAGIRPSQAAVATGVGLAALLTLIVLRLGRLWYLLRRLLDVFVRDAVEAPVREPGS